MLQGGARASHGGDGLTPLIPPVGPTTHNHFSPPQHVHSFVSFAFLALSTDLGIWYALQSFVKLMSKALVERLNGE